MRGSLVLLLLLLGIATVARATDIVRDQLFAYQDAGYTAAYEDRWHTTVNFSVPNGSRDGFYYFRTTEGWDMAVISVSAGISSHDAAHPLVVDWVTSPGIVAPPGTTQLSVAKPQAGGGWVWEPKATLITKASEIHGAAARASVLYELGPVDISSDGAANPKKEIGTVQMAGNDGKAHTVKIYRNGSVVHTTNLPAGPVGGDLQKVNDAGFEVTDAKTGDVFTYSVDGGAQRSLGTATFPEGALSWTIPTVQQAWTVQATPPDTGPSTGTQSNQGSTTQSGGSSQPGGTQTPQTIVNNGNTTISGGSTGATNQDIYEDVLRANIDAGNSSRSSTMAQTVDLGDAPQAGDDLDKEKALQTLGTVGDLVTQKQQDFASDKALQVPTVSGSQYTFQVTLPKLGDVTIDLSPYTAQIQWFRDLCKLWLTIMFWFVSIKTIRAAIA